MAIKLTLRQKLISKGRKSLSLDFYPPIPHPETGKSTRREFLNMYWFVDKAELKKELTEKKEKGDNIVALLEFNIAPKARTTYCHLRKKKIKIGSF